MPSRLAKPHFICNIVILINAPGCAAILKLENDIHVHGTKIWAKIRHFNSLKPILIAFGHLSLQKKWEVACIRAGVFIRINTVFK